MTGAQSEFVYIRSGKVVCFSKPYLEIPLLAQEKSRAQFLIKKISYGMVNDNSEMLPKSLGGFKMQICCLFIARTMLF